MLEKLPERSAYLEDLIIGYIKEFNNGKPSDAQLMEIMTRFTRSVKYDTSLYDFAYEVMAKQLRISVEALKKKMTYSEKKEDENDL